MFDENKYPTMKLMRCGKCGNVYAASLSGVNSCPECGASGDSSKFTPEESENKDDGPKNR